MPIRTVEDLEAEILARARESLDAAGQDCARSGHAWKELETNAADGRPAAYSAICLSGIARGPTALGFAAVALFYAAVMAREEWTGCWRSRARWLVTSLLFLWSAKRKRQGRRGVYRLPH